MTTGIGQASGHLAEGFDVLQAALDGPVVPGTLNVELNMAFLAPPESAAIRIPRLPWRDVPFFLYPGLLDHHQAIWVIRSLRQLERTDDLLELIARVQLRTTLGLADGDTVTVTLGGYE